MYYCNQIYDDEGNYKCDLEFDEKIVRPSDIHIDSEGFLYVTCFIQHTIKKYKFICLEYHDDSYILLLE